MLGRVALVRINVSEERQFLQEPRHNISEGGILHSHRRENQKSHLDVM
jgi:hypothetical protein